MRALVVLSLLLALPLAGPAMAQVSQVDDEPPLATPRPNAQGQLPIDAAQQKVRKYIHSIPGMKEDVVVVPASGLVPWPLAPVDKGIRAEVWTVVPREGNKTGNPIMMFAVRTDTGEVYAMFLRDLQKEPTFR